jgi:hypothetical protein
MRKLLMLGLCSPLITGVICGCGGGSAPPAAKAPEIRGTAAAGLGFGGVKVDVKDGNGISDGGQTDGNGNFTIPMTKLKSPPYLLRITTATSPTPLYLYSVSADENAAPTVNITPLTDMIIRSWYSAQTPPVTIEDAFADPVTYPAPKPDAVSLIHSLIKNVVQLWLDKNGVTDSDFNLISTPFTAGTLSVPGTGFDKVLDQTWVNAAAGQIVISNGTTTQNTTLNAFLSSLTASTTTVSSGTGPTVESGNNDLTSVPTTAVMQAALTGINTTLANIANTINAKGMFLTDADLLPYLDPSLVNDGFNQIQFAQILGMVARSAKSTGRTVFFTLKSIKSLDTVAKIAEVRLEGIGLAILKNDTPTGKWLISGNGRMANVAVQMLMVNQQGNTCPTCSGPTVNVKVEGQPGVVSSVSITGGNWVAPAAVPYLDQVINSGITLDRFFLQSGVLPQMPAKDTPFTVTVSTAGTTAPYIELSNAYTIEPISITKIDGVAPGATLVDAHLDSTITVEWTEPTTFPIRMRALNYQVFTAGPTCMGSASSVSVSTGTINMPSQCGVGNPATQVNLSVYIFGMNGEITNALWVFKP